MNWETKHKETVQGFDIELAIAPEEDSPRGHFDSGDAEEDQEIFDKIENGTYLWFMARVTASKAGVTLGTDHLGGCCYESTSAFMAEPGSYYPDMVRAAIAEAKATLEKLCPDADMRKALSDMAAQDPFTCHADAPIPVKQLIELLNAWREKAVQLTQ